MKNPDVSNNGMARALRDSLIKERGQAGVPEAEEFLKNSVYGIPLTGNLPLQYVLGVNVVALGRTFCLKGRTNTGKTNLALELSRIFLNNSGLTTFIDIESKPSPAIVRGLIDNDKAFIEEGRHVALPGGDLDTLLHLSAYCANFYKENFDKKNPVPMCLIWDSLSMAIEIEKKKAMADNKAADDEGYEAAHRAKRISTWLKTFIGTYLETLPMILVMIHHEKGKMGDQYGGTYTSGGVLKDFAATYELGISRQAAKFQKGGNSQRMFIKGTKCQTGWTGHKVEVNLKGIWDDQDVQRYYFDWDEALMDLLKRDDTEISPAKVQNIFDYNRNAKTNRYTSKKYKLENVTATEMGKAVHADPEAVAALQKLMHISRMEGIEAKFGGS
jgi:hypothetical protein